MIARDDPKVVAAQARSGRAQAGEGDALALLAVVQPERDDDGEDARGHEYGGEGREDQQIGERVLRLRAVEGHDEVFFDDPPSTSPRAMPAGMIFALSSR